MNRAPASHLLLLLAVLALAAPAPAAAEDLPYPPGTSNREIEGIRTYLDVPEGLSKEHPASLLVVLHGSGGKAANMVAGFGAWARDGYVVMATQAADVSWQMPELDKTLRVAAHLKEVLPIDPAKVHVVGFSNGGWNLHPLAFDDDLHPCTAAWIAAGFRGGKVPKWAKKGLAAIALAGTQDPNAKAAGQTVPNLRGKVRSVEVRYQPGLDHKMPRELLPYLQWWMGVQEGRYTPGDEQSFDWTEDLDAAVASLKGAKKGGVMVYVFSEEDAKNPDAAETQRDVFMDEAVRFYGGQLKAVKLDRAKHEETVAKLGVEETPAVAVLDRTGKVKKVLEGAMKPSKVAKALKGVAPLRRMPKE